MPSTFYTKYEKNRIPDKTEVWRLKQFSNNENIGILKSHVWLENVFDGSVLDLSFDQSIDDYGKYIEFPYDIGTYVNSNFDFQRAYKFAKYIGINLEDTVFINSIFSNIHL